jgi:PAS domain S-box-containing protein
MKQKEAKRAGAPGERPGPNGEGHISHAELERLYRSLVGQSLAGVFRSTLDGRWLECNDAMARMFGYADRRELLALPTTVIYPDTATRAAFIAELRDKGRLQNHELRLRHKDGRDVYVLENVWLDLDGDPVTIQGTVIDITHQKGIELEREQLINSYRELVERVQDGLLVLVDGRVRYANPAVMALSDQQVVGLSWEHLFQPDDLPEARSIINETEHTGRGGPRTLRLKNGRELLVIAGRTMLDGRSGVQITLYDHRAHEDMLKDRVRARIAEEVNEVLRQEILEHRRTQEALRRSRHFSRLLVDSSLDMIMAVDNEGRITEFNPAATVRFGWEAAEVLGRETSMLYADPDEFLKVRGELDRHGMFAGEINNRTRDGEIFTSFLTASRLYDAEGTPIGAMGVSRDITRMKRDQEALRASEERYRDLFENATDLIQSIDAGGRFQFVNAAWCRTLGYSTEEARELSLWDLVHPEHRATTKALYEQVFAGNNVPVVETVLVARDGRNVHVEGRTNARYEEGRVVATRGIFRDVTEVHRERRRAQAQEAKLRALFESSEHMFWTVDRAIKLTSFNQSYANMVERLHGQRPVVDLEPTTPRRKFASEAYHRIWEERYAEAFAGKPLRFETDLVDQHGRRVCNEIFLSPVFDAEGNVGEVFGVGHEITELKVAEEQVREQAARMQAIFDSSANVMICTVDRELRLTSFNEHFRRSVEQDFGVRFRIGDHYLDKQASRAAGPNDQRYRENFFAVLREGKPRRFEARLTGLTGRTIWVENFLNPIMIDGHVQEISCLAYHSTESKEAQLELERSLAEKEVLLKEVHHRVKNNLQIISSIFNLQTAHVGDDQRVLALLRDSRDRIRSMSYIHESIYLNKDLSSVDLAGYIESLGRNLIMGYDLGGRVRLETALEPVELVIDEAIPCGLILNELISNALKHAFPDGSGTIRVELTTSGDRVRVSVRDDGQGLPAAITATHGGNLGLDLVRTLADQLNADLDIASQGGAAFSLTFERTKHTAHAPDKRARGGR